MTATTKKKKPTYDVDWQKKYSSIIMSAEDAVSQIRPGQRVFIGTGCATPQKLVETLTNRTADLTDTEVVHLLTFGRAPYAQQKLAEHFRVNSFFIADNVRDIIQEGHGDYTPVFLSDIPRLFSSGQMPLDAVLIQVTPPDERGMCSLGVSVDIVKSAAENAALVIAQVNPLMPRTHGDSFVHVQDLDILVEGQEDLVEVFPEEATEVTQQIGENVASLIEDGSTIEVGIGRIPQAVLKFLRDKKDLGIHTEMFTDAIIDLVENGVVTGARKALDRGKVVASFCLGTHKLYDYVDDNDVFCFRPSEYVNDPVVISQQYKMVAINVALEIDLTGQVCADSLGTKFFSGIGGQVDFNRGAARSTGGKAIIALPSTAQKGSVSRIVSHLSDGAGVVTTRGDVHYIVTEHGIAYLHGKTVQERALALISVAHPDYREKLLKEAIASKYVRSTLRDVENKMYVGSQNLKTSMILNDGTQVTFRPIHPTDESRIRDLFYALSQETVYYRFMKEMKSLPQKQVQDFVYVDHRNDMAIVATLPEAHGEDIIAIGRYYLDNKTNMAEVAFVVRDQWQNRGIGAFLLDYLTSIAKRQGIRGFTAEVLNKNKPMQSVLNRADCNVRSTIVDGVHSFELLFD